MLIGFMVILCAGAALAIKFSTQDEEESKAELAQALA